MLARPKQLFLWNLTAIVFIPLKLAEQPQFLWQHGRTAFTISLDIGHWKKVVTNSSHTQLLKAVLLARLLELGLIQRIQQHYLLTGRNMRSQSALTPTAELSIRQFPLTKVLLTKIFPWKWKNLSLCLVKRISLDRVMCLLVGRLQHLKVWKSQTTL